ncbi:MAG: M48 family metallopeptidase [Ignavibacteria bacterium]
MEINIEKIIYTNRKTISLHITDNATLIVKAPFDANNEIIMKVVSNHINWINNKINEIKKRDPKFVAREFVSGEGFLFLGRYYKLNIVDEQDEPLKFENNFYLSRKELSKAKEIFIDWYKKIAKEKITERVQRYAQISGLSYNSINITDAQKRWGSCSHNGNLNFSWRLIMAPLGVIDYVVVHELAHLEIKNHSKAFWNKVKILMPDYEKHKDWLTKNNYFLKL